MMFFYRGGREAGREGEGRGGIKGSSVVQTAANESTDASELKVFLTNYHFLEDF